MYSDGSLSNKIKYTDICIDNFVVSIVYYTKPGFFEIVNNTMVEWYDFWNLLTDYSMIVYDFEILKPFFQNNNIIVNWKAASSYNLWGFLKQVNNYQEYKFTFKIKYILV